MTQEQIDALKGALRQVSDACAEAEKMVSDYSKCESDVSRKYLGAAIKKHASAIPQMLKPEIFNFG